MLTLAPWETVVHQDGSIESRPAEVDGDYVSIDLRAPGEPTGWCLVATAMSVCPVSHELLSDGAPCREVLPNGRQRVKWTAACRAQSPMGDTLEDWIIHRFSTQADSRGTVHSKPALPQHGQARLDIHLGAYSFSTPFVADRQADARILPAVALHQAEYAKLREEQGVTAARQYLQRLVERYKLGGQRYQVIQGEFTNDGPPLPHGTTHSDTFDGTLAAWTDFSGGNFSVSGGQLVHSSAASHNQIRYDTTLGADHYSLVTNATSNNTATLGPFTRFATGSTPTGYTCYYALTAGTPGTLRFRRHTNASTFATVASYTYSHASPHTIKLDSSGSSHSTYVNGALAGGPTTDSTYTDTYAGCYGYGSGTIDAWEASDGAGGSSTGAAAYRHMQNLGVY